MFLWIYLHESMHKNVKADPKIDASTWSFYERRGDLDPPRQTCIEEMETFSDWMRRQANETNYYQLARFVDKSSAKHFAVTLAPEITTAQTLALFTRPRLRALRKYEFPESFAFKAVHGSGMNLLIANKKVFAGNRGKYSSKKRFTGEEMKQLARTWLSRCYNCIAEPQYKRVRKAVIVEEFLGIHLPIEYKLFIFGGKIYAVQVRLFEVMPKTSQGSHMRTRIFQNRNGTTLSTADLAASAAGFVPELPSQVALQKMYNAGRLIAEGFRFVRVDFYILNETVYFGEITLSPLQATDALNGFFDKEHLKSSIGLCSAEQSSEYLESD